MTTTGQKQTPDSIVPVACVMVLVSLLKVLKDKDPTLIAALEKDLALLLDTELGSANPDSVDFAKLMVEEVKNV